MKSLPKVIPPRSRVRLVRFDKRTPAWRKDVGREFRVGYYNRKNGLGCTWLVNEDGKYEQTTDREFLLVGCSSFRVDLGVIDPSRQVCILFRHQRRAA